MDGTLFGSYSLTEYKDLYDINIRRNHSHSVTIEVDQKGVVTLKYGKIDSLHKRFHNSFLIGMHAPTLSNISLDNKNITYFESKYTQSRDDLFMICGKKKEYFLLTLEAGSVKFITPKTNPLYMSENHSFSTSPVLDFIPIRGNVYHEFKIYSGNDFNTHSLDLKAI